MGTAVENGDIIYKEIEKRRKEINKAKNKEKQRSNRIKETPEEIENKKKKDAARQKERRTEETPEEIENKKKKDAVRQKERRTEETPEEREHRNKKDAARQKEHRDTETPEETENRNKKQAAKQKERRTEETPEETENRNKKDAERQKKYRTEETPEETENRNKKDAARQKKHRTEQTRKETEDRKKKDAARQKKLYALSKVFRARNYEQTDHDKFTSDDKVKRRKKFQDSVHLGPIYVCSCCSRMLFSNSVSKVTNKIRETIYKNGEELLSCLKEYKSPDNVIYICSTCKKALCEGRMPAMAVENAMDITDIDKRYELTELENNLIAQNINFQKMILLPKSRWAAGKGRMVSVPVGAQDVMNTMKQVPRLSEEAGLIPIKLKRKKEYRGHEKSELVRPEKLFKVLKKLKECKHPYYQVYYTQEEYDYRCRERDKRNGRMQLGDQDQDNVEEILDPLLTEEENQELNDEVLEGENEDDLKEEIDREEQDLRNDPVRRQHFNYSENSVLVNGHPEVMLDGDGNQVADLNFSPAEGKVPENFLYQKDWDIKSWPTLHPDGKFGMDHRRKVKITRQNYFGQRIMNKNKKFAKTPGYVFGATSYVESERLRNNANISGYRGKKDTDEEGKVSYNIKDPFTVFDKVPNTPKYWQNVRYEMMAKMENIGPFTGSLH